MKKIFLFILLSLPSLLMAQGSVYPQNLRCEYLINPQGIDEPLPRLGWTLAAVNPRAFGQRQTAYRLIVASSISALENGRGDMWDTDWVLSSEMQVVYKGRQLLSDRNYYWKICVKDEHAKQSKWSEIAYWSTGLFYHEDWTAKWIGNGESRDMNKEDNDVADPWMRKTFQLTHKPAKATMFVASVGYHELYVNGKKIGNDVLSPAVSSHLIRARYVAYNIAPELKSGKNVIAIWLGTSWSVFESYETKDKPLAPIVIAQADMYNTDDPGEIPALRIQTDETWKTHPSPNYLLGKWQFGHMGGELWDANKELPCWNQTDCDETDWKPPVVYTPRLMLTAQMVQPNRLRTPVKPVSVEQLADGSYVVDMGVNFAGWTEIKLKAKPGQRVDMLFSEREGQEMTFDIHNAYIMGSTGEGIFRNRFNYSSGRWITIRGLMEKPQLTDIKGWVVTTNYPSASTFDSSDSLQNWMYDRIRWTFENLSLGGYVVDCPQRERLGYGGDAHATSETGMFNYDLGAFYTKWMEDWRDVQGAKTLDPVNYGGNADYGILPHTAPTYQGGGGPGWGGIVVILPWTIYQHEGDKKILEKNFELIKNWLAFLNSHTQNNLMVRFGGKWDFLGDWLWPHAGAEGMNNDKPQNICFNNCYHVYNLRTAVKIAKILGKTDEATLWQQQANASAKAIQAKYFNADDNSYSDRSMGNLAAALLAGVPPANLRPLVMKRLEKEILEVQHSHINVGITGGAMLFKLLRNEGRDDLIYSMTSQTDYPGWGYMKANGATSIWEMWEKDLPGHSLLHSSYLYPGAWYIEGVAGIHRDTANPGFKSFIVRPPLLTESQLTWAKASFNSPIGTIKTAWQRKDGNLNLEVTVPPGATAKVYFPSVNTSGIKVSSVWAKKAGVANGYSLFKLTPGQYTFSGRERIAVFQK